MIDLGVDEEAFWQAAYVAAVRAGTTRIGYASAADNAVVALRERQAARRERERRPQGVVLAAYGDAAARKRLAAEGGPEQAGTDSPEESG